MTKEPQRKRTTEEVLEIVGSEGLGYACHNYCSGEDFEDRKLAELWDSAGKALDLLDQYLNDYESVQNGIEGGCPDV